MNNNTTPPLFTDQSEKKGIVLNRMYTGSYLSSNLGHEVINMFQADNGKHYLYLNAKGNFSDSGKKVSTMLLVRHIEKNKVEVVGMAKNLKYVESAFCTLPRDIARVNEDVRKDQLGLQIRYGGVSIEKIFGTQGQQSVYVSYWVEPEDFYRPKFGNRLIIEFTGKSETYLVTSDESREIESCDNGNNIKTIKLNENFASTSLHQFILDDDSVNKFDDICDKNLENFWECKSEMILPKDFEEREISLFDICQLQKDENKFSNALSYFMQKYPKLWIKFLEEYFKKKYSFGEIISVSREENAKVDGKDNTGGRIDLLIRTENSYIIIENKIDSDIIVEGNITQLQRYYNYVECLKEGEQNRLEKYEEKLKHKYNKRNNQYNGLSDIAQQKNGGWAERWKNDIVILEKKLEVTKSNIEKLKSRKVIGVVLYPDYNKPDEVLLKIDDFNKYNKLPYSEIYNWLKDNAKDTLSNDANFKAFYNAMKQHTFKYRSESLYEEMKEIFFSRIKELSIMK